jgi:superfamily II DNA/RNA helicase
MDMLHTRMGNGAANRSEKGCVVHGLLPVDVQRDGEGMDFPSVTTVIQVGASPPELYTQRVGRSGRGDRGERRASARAGGVS